MGKLNIFVPEDMGHPNNFYIYYVEINKKTMPQCIRNFMDFNNIKSDIRSIRKQIIQLFGDQAIMEAISLPSSTVPQEGYITWYYEKVPVKLNLFSLGKYYALHLKRSRAAALNAWITEHKMDREKILNEDFSDTNICDFISHNEELLKEAVSMEPEMIDAGYSQWIQSTLTRQYIYLNPHQILQNQLFLGNREDFYGLEREQ